MTSFPVPSGEEEPPVGGLVAPGGGGAGGGGTGADDQGSRPEPEEDGGKSGFRVGEPSPEVLAASGPSGANDAALPDASSGPRGLAPAKADEDPSRLGESTATDSSSSGRRAPAADGWNDAEPPADSRRREESSVPAARPRRRRWALAGLVATTSIAAGLLALQMSLVESPSRVTTRGGAYLYTSSPAVAASMVVSLREVDTPSPEALIDVQFLGGPPAEWALVLVGDARFAPGDGVGGTSAQASIATPVHMVEASVPPLVDVREGDETAQVFLGATANFQAGQGTGLLRLKGRLQHDVVSRSYAQSEYAFPAFGRVVAPLGFEEVEQAAAISPEVPGGPFFPPQSFMVQVRLAEPDELAGDIVRSNPQLNPGSVEPAWASPTAVAPVLRVQDETKQQVSSFTVGAVVGVVTSLLASALVAAARPAGW